MKTLTDIRPKRTMAIVSRWDCGMASHIHQTPASAVVCMNKQRVEKERAAQWPRVLAATRAIIRGASWMEAATIMGRSYGRTTEIIRHIMGRLFEYEHPIYRRDDWYYLVVIRENEAIWIERLTRVYGGK